MKEVSLLISNRDSYEAVQLCIESIRKYTQYPHKIIVFDDRSKNGVDLDYLRDAQEKGWLELHENNAPFPLTHGGSLNMLINQLCDTDHAMIMDCDVMIKKSGWLKDIMDVALTDENILAVVDTKDKGYTWKGFRTPIYHFWFGLLNMRAYNDGMRTIWINNVEDASKEPYKSLFSDLADASKNPYFMSLVKQGKVVLSRWDKNIVSNDSGAQLWLKVTYSNPKKYRVVPMPKGLHDKHCHFGHASIIGTMAHSDEKSYDADMARLKFDEIRKNLEVLRHG